MKISGILRLAVCLSLQRVSGHMDDLVQDDSASSSERLDHEDHLK